MDPDVVIHMLAEDVAELRGRLNEAVGQVEQVVGKNRALQAELDGWKQSAEPVSPAD